MGEWLGRISPLILRIRNMEIDTMISYAQEVELIRFVGNHLLPSKFLIDFHLEIDDNTDEITVCSALEKFEFWIDN